MRQAKPPRKTRKAERPKTAWRLIQGDSKRVHKVVQEILDGTGDDAFEVEFRIYRSTRRGADIPEAEKPTPPARVVRQEKIRERPRPRFRSRKSSLPWKPVLLAMVPIALAVFYLTRVAPSLVPVPPSVQVPFPAVTRFLEAVCLWCGEFPLVAVLIGLALLAPGLLFQVLRKPERYYLPLAVVVSLALGLTYLSISAPLDGASHAVGAMEPGLPGSSSQSSTQDSDL